MATVLKTVIGASQSRVQIPAPPPFAASLAGWLAFIAPPIAAIIVTVAGVLTPGYDPITRTVSRLAEPGRPAAIEVDLAVYLVAFALLMLAVSTRPRGLLAVAGCALVVVASVRLDPTSTATTAVHRLASGVAMLALAAAPFRFAAARARYSRALGVAMIGLLVIAVVLVPTGFSAWGLWERAFLFIAMASIMVMSRFLADEAMRAPAAIVSRSVS